MLTLQSPYLRRFPLNEERRHRNRKRDSETRGEGAGRQGAACCPRVVAVKAAIHDPVESHRSAPGSDHRGQDPDDLPGAGQPSGGEQGRDQRERKREDRMLEPDHLERYLEFVPDQSFFSSTT